jgi:hypothetical protein
MPFLFNRNSIREALKNHPGKARRLLVRQGHEKLSEELIEEARRQGVAFRVLPSEAFAKKCGSPRSHVCLEREDFDYTDQDIFSNVSIPWAPFSWERSMACRTPRTWEHSEKLGLPGHRRPHSSQGPFLRD